MKNVGSRILFLHSISLALLVFLLALFISFWGTAGYAVTFAVTNTNDSGEGSLRAAINSANSYDDLISFDVTGTITLNSQLEISGDKGMKIQGPGAELLAVSGNDACRVFYIATTASVDISGISIVSGSADMGGGMYNYRSNPIITNCIFSSNTACNDIHATGGGMLNRDSSPIVTNCTFSENSSSVYGGGMGNDSGSRPTVTNCIFNSNSALHGGGICNWYLYTSPFTNCTFSSNTAHSGGGMYNFESLPELTTCTFSENTATQKGGGMYNSVSSPDVTNCTFNGNNANDYGGGIYNYSSDSAVTNCTFFENHAENHGGGICNYESTFHVSDCTFDTNSADYGGGMFNDFAPSSSVTASTVIQGNTFTGNIGVNKGGAIYNEYAKTVEIINCTLILNSAEYGGGIYSYSSSPIITNCTLTGNTANSGVSMYSKESEPVVRNCIFWEDDGVEVVNSLSSPDIAFCVVENQITGVTDISDIITADPMLETLDDNGGPTWTCALGRGSSAIDEGTDEGDVPVTDQRGIERPQGTGYDIGAYEHEPGTDDYNDSGGCNISSLPAVGFLLLMPLMFLSGKRK